MSGLLEHVTRELTRLAASERDQLVEAKAAYMQDAEFHAAVHTLWQTTVESQNQVQTLSGDEREQIKLGIVAGLHLATTLPHTPTLGQDGEAFYVACSCGNPGALWATPVGAVRQWLEHLIAELLPDEMRDVTAGWVFEVSPEQVST
jgi:hypothetical protein